MDCISREGCTPVGLVAVRLQGLDLLVWVDCLSKFFRSGGLECHPVGAMSESVLHVFNLSTVAGRHNIFFVSLESPTNTDLFRELYILGCMCSPTIHNYTSPLPS